MILIKNILAKLVASIHILLDMVNRKIVKDSNIKESMKEMVDGKISEEEFDRAKKSLQFSKGI